MGVDILYKWFKISLEIEKVLKIQWIQKIIIQKLLVCIINIMVENSNLYD